MGLQEYFVTKKRHNEKEFVEVFGEQVACVSLVKDAIIGIDFPGLSQIDGGTELMLLYGDRHDLRDKLYENFSDEIFLGVEFVYEAAFGCSFPNQQQISELFEDRPPGLYGIEG